VILGGRNGFALVIVLSLPALFLVLATMVNGLTPDGRPLVGWPGSDPCAALDDEHERVACMLPTLSKLPLEFEWDRGRTGDPAGGEAKARSALAILADDLKARYAFAIPSALLIFLAAPIATVGLVGLARSGRGLWLAVGVVAAVAAALGGLHFQDSHPIRILSAEHILWLAATGGGYDYLTRENWAFAFRAVDAVTVAAMTAAAVLITLFAALSVRAPPGRLTISELKRRADWFKTALGLGSIVLILAVAATHGLFNWSSVLMAPGSREAFGSLASSAALSRGVLYSLTLVMVTVPTVTAIRLDLAALPRGPGGEDPGEAFDKAGLNFDLRRIAVTLATIAGPALTGPALDLIGNLGG
jgi:hypothetical protein